MLTIYHMPPTRSVRVTLARRGNGPALPDGGSFHPNPIACISRGESARPIACDQGWRHHDDREHRDHAISDGPPRADRPRREARGKGLPGPTFNSSSLARLGFAQSAMPASRRNTWRPRPSGKTGLRTILPRRSESGLASRAATCRIGNMLRRIASPRRTSRSAGRLAFTRCSACWRTPILCLIRISCG